MRINFNQRFRDCIPLQLRGLPRKGDFCVSILITNLHLLGTHRYTAWLLGSNCKGCVLDANGFDPTAAPSVVCDILAAAVVHATPDQMAKLRRDPGLPVPASALRNADDQAVVGVAAVI